MGWDHLQNDDLIYLITDQVIFHHSIFQARNTEFRIDNRAAIHK
jgi:hypothetical protein